MADITAAAVKSLREKTGLPMMECKKALVETGGDESAAVDFLRKQGIKTAETRVGRETSAGRVAVYTDLDAGVGAMVEVLCESAPVAGSDEFKQFANDVVLQLATGPGANTPDELLAQKSPGGSSQTLKDRLDDMFNRIREVFKVGRIVRIDSPCGGYAHHTGTSGVLVKVSGGNAEVAKDVAMHVAAQKPAVVAKEDLDPAAIDKERQILTEAALQEGKPANIVEKMVEGRLKNFYAERVLLEQPFVKDDSMTVGKYAAGAGLKIQGFVRWELGKE
jgi:elongation factor Ts